MKAQKLINKITLLILLILTIIITIGAIKTENPQGKNILGIFIVVFATLSLLVASFIKQDAQNN